jgi:FtsH-binding integral membrane protein
MAEHDSKLVRHEVRGLLVLGVIGTLVALWQLPNFVFVESPRITLHITIAIITGVWGLFIFFMAIAVSEDWVWKRLVDASYQIAKALFLLGIGFLFALLVMIAVYYSPLGASYAIPVGLATAFVLGFLLYVTKPSEKPSNEPAR